MTNWVGKLERLILKTYVMFRGLCETLPARQTGWVNCEDNFEVVNYKDENSQIYDFTFLSHLTFILSGVR